MVTGREGPHKLERRHVWLDVNAADDAQGVDKRELDPFN